MDRRTARMVEQLHRRATMLAALGTVTAADDGGSAQRLQVQIGPYELRDGLPRVAEYGFTSVPLPGADAVALFLAGDRSNGLVISTGDQRYRLRALAGGEVALWDDQGQVVKIGRAGIVVSGAGKQVTITGTPVVRIEADLHVTGEVLGHCDGGSVGLTSHDHNDPQGGTTSPANAGT